MKNPPEFNQGTDLPRQYIVTAPGTDTPPGWHSLPFGGQQFHLAPGTPHQMLTTADTSYLVLGWIFGLDETAPAPFTHTFGRYVVFAHKADRLTCTVDAFGNYPLVYCPARRIAGSSPTALNLIHPLTARTDLLNSFADTAQAMWFPFGLTPFEGVERLMPHHQLDLQNWQCTRTSLPGDLPAPVSESDAGAVTDTIARAVQSNIETMAQSGPYHLLLSGGYDSRMVLAACKTTQSQLICSTLNVPGSGGSIDMDLARTLAKRHGFTHRAIDLLPQSPADRDAWLDRVGYCVRDTVTTLAATVEHYFPDDLSATGTGADLVKGKHIRKSDLASTQSLSPEDILRRYNLPLDPAMIAATDRWITELHGQSLPRVLDYMHIEARFGCWASASAVGHRIKTPSFSPFNSEHIRAQVLILPHAYRMRGAFVQRYFETLWPALLDTPINRATGWRRLRHLKSELKDMIPREIKDAIKARRG